jgi:folylpolyglutamate synthase/dihydropteroate synthase
MVVRMIKPIAPTQKFKPQRYSKKIPPVKEAYNAAIENAEKGDFIFVGGSSYVVADLLS